MMDPKISDTPSLIRGALEDVKRLVSLEAKLLRLELFHLGGRAKKALILGALAFSVALASLVVLLMAGAEALTTFTTLLPWAAYAIAATTGLSMALFVGWRAACIFSQDKENTDGNTRVIGTGNSGHDPVVDG